MPTTDELLTKMVSLLEMDGVWHARARGQQHFAKGATAREAMLAALGLCEEPNADLF
jgi:hypothetical protein